MNRRGDCGDCSLPAFGRAKLLAIGEFAVALLAAGSASSSGAAETSATAIATTSSPVATTSLPAVTTSRSPTAMSIPSSTTETVGAPMTAVPTDLGVATCFDTADPDGPNSSTGVAFGYKEGEENIVGVEELVFACRDGLVSRGRLEQADPVAACVLENGELGDFPGDDDVCTRLHLPVADPSASAPLPNPNG